jgi:hypothetical protein
MTVVGMLLALLNCLAVAIVLVIIGAVIAWIAAAFDWPIPWNIQRLFLLLVLLLFVVCVISALAGAPMVHFFNHA